MAFEERDLCANCGHWREEHYGHGGQWRGDKIGCPEYAGTNPSPERRKKKLDELSSVSTPEPDYGKSKK